MKQDQKNVLTTTKSAHFPSEPDDISGETNPNSEDENLQKTLLLEHFPFDPVIDDKDNTERVPYSLVHKFVNLFSGQSAISKVKTEPENSTEER